MVEDLGGERPCKGWINAFGAWGVRRREDRALAEGGVCVALGQARLVGDGDHVEIRVRQRDGVVRREADQVVEVAQTPKVGILQRAV